MRHTVQFQATVKVFRDAGRQLRPGFVALRHQAFLFFAPERRSQTARGLREEADGRTSRRRSVTEADTPCRNHRLTKPERKNHTSEPNGDSRGSSSNVKRSSNRPSAKRQVISSGLSTLITIARLPVRRSTMISPRCGMDTSIGSLSKGCEEKARSLFFVRA